jgi:hypothetical protein
MLMQSANIQLRHWSTHSMFQHTQCVATRAVCCNTRSMFQHAQYVPTGAVCSNTRGMFQHAQYVTTHAVCSNTRSMFQTPPAILRDPQQHYCSLTADKSVPLKTLTAHYSYYSHHLYCTHHFYCSHHLYYRHRLYCRHKLHCSHHLHTQKLCMSAPHHITQQFTQTMYVCAAHHATVHTKFAHRTEGKGRGRPATGCEGPECEHRYSSAPSLTSALGGYRGVNATPRPLYPRERDPVPNYTVSDTRLNIKRSRVLREKLTVPWLLKEFPTFYGTPRFITSFTTARHLSYAVAD